jgi:hypothetical protein
MVLSTSTASVVSGTVKVGGTGVAAAVDGTHVGVPQEASIQDKNTPNVRRVFHLISVYLSG